MTATVVDWLPLFGQPEHAQIIFEAMRYRTERGRWTLYAYVLMEHHLHWIAAAPDLAGEVRSFKSYTARRIIDKLKQRNMQGTLLRLALHKKRYKTDQQYQVWQEGSHPQQIQGEAMLRQKIAYIHQNPVKRGYVDDPVHWCYSSARAYAGREAGLVPVQIML